MQKIAIALVHGVGKQDPDFAVKITQKLISRIARDMRIREAEVQERFVFQPVYWAPVLQKLENALLDRVKRGEALDWMLARHLLMDYGADAVAYQPTPWDRSVYDAVHGVFAGVLKGLAGEAGEGAPLCVVAHSLGTVIASNFFYDLQVEFTHARTVLSPEFRTRVEETPLERGQTFSLFYTFGSPIAMWSLRYKNFGIPISVPSLELGKYYPPEAYPELLGEWVNFYDRDDAIGYPLRPVNAAYATTVTEDREVNAGGVLAGWNPASHLAYWTDAQVVDPIAAGLAKLSRAVNP